MYPVLRFAKELVKYRNAPLAPFETHVSQHICWPIDIDPWRELNNGRTLTVYDLGRIPLAQRTGLVSVLRRRRWGLTVAGSSLRYRRRVRVFDRIEMRSRLVGWDARFVYLEQSMWKRDGECASHALFRTAVTDASGIVAPAEVARELGLDPASPPLPDWITAWIDAEAARSWPPTRD